jgi:hypothetical protein
MLVHVVAAFDSVQDPSICLKLLYQLSTFSGYAILARSDRFFFTPNAAGVTLRVALALAGLRHMFMVTYWPAVKRWICSRLSCEACLRDNRSAMSQARSTGVRPSADRTTNQATLVLWRGQ